jgi:hypothetical protein
MTPRLTVLHVPDCPHVAALLDNLREVTDVPVETREIATEAEAVASGMAGSPTLLVDGRAPFGTPDGRERGLACRLFYDEHDRPVPVPSVAQLRMVVAESNDHAEVLSAWRGRALPMDPALRVAHQATLRSFAETGRAPDGLDASLLRELHELDAIRLAPDGRTAGSPSRIRSPLRRPGTASRSAAGPRCTRCAPSTRSASRR